MRLAFDGVTTERLLLRRPVESDLDEVHAIHGDPATNHYNPEGHDLGRSESLRRLRDWLDHWDAHGFGYWAVQKLGTGPESETVLGFAGIRYGQWRNISVLNLYYRFDPRSWGNGYATEVARYAVRLAEQHFPGIPVLARTVADNIPSRRTALAAGLTRRADLDGHDGICQAVVLVSHWPVPQPISPARS